MPAFKWEIQEVEQIAKDFQAKKINGVFVDVQSANAMVQVFNQFNEANKIKVQSIPIEKFARFVWDVVSH